MSLLSDAYEPFYFIEKRFVPDGAFGLKPTWTQGAEFLATANFPNSSLSKIADKLTEKTNCTITTSKAIKLDAMDVIQRKSDGTIFRILSSGKDSLFIISFCANLFVCFIAFVKNMQIHFKKVPKNMHYFCIFS